MNRKGQAMLFGVMVAIISFITIVVLATPVKDMVDLARDSDNLNCDADSITAGTAMTCVGVDLFLPFLTLTAIFAALAIVSRLAGA